MAATGFEAPRQAWPALPGTCALAGDLRMGLHLLRLPSRKMSYTVCWAVRSAGRELTKSLILSK
jgi:hypothetical protein